MEDITVEFGFAWAHDGDETENLFQVCVNDDDLINPSDCGWNEGLCGDYNGSVGANEETFKQFIELARQRGLLIQN